MCLNANVWFHTRCRDLHSDKLYLVYWWIEVKEIIPRRSVGDCVGIGRLWCHLKYVFITFVYSGIVRHVIVKSNLEDFAYL